GPVGGTGLREGEAESAQAVVVVVLLAGRFIRTDLDREKPHHVPAVGEKPAHEDDVALVAGTRISLLGKGGRQTIHPFHHGSHAVETGSLVPVAGSHLRLGAS